MKTKPFLFAALLLSVAGHVFAEPVEIDGIWYNLVSKAKKAEVTYNPNLEYHANSYTGAVNIPESVTYNDVDYNVTSIGEEAFRYCSSLISINIPESVTSIGAVAFYGCSRLSTLNFNADSCTYMGYLSNNLIYDAFSKVRRRF